MDFVLSIWSLALRSVTIGDCRPSEPPLEVDRRSVGRLMTLAGELAIIVSGESDLVDTEGE